MKPLSLVELKKIQALNIDDETLDRLLFTSYLAHVMKEALDRIGQGEETEAKNIAGKALVLWSTQIS